MIGNRTPQRRWLRPLHRDQSVSRETCPTSGRVSPAGARLPARTPSSRMRRARSTRLRHSPAARRIVAASSVGALQGQVARDGLEIVESQFDADRLAGVALARRSSLSSDAQLGEDARQLRAVAHRVQVALEGGFAADRLGSLNVSTASFIATAPRRREPGTTCLTEVTASASGLGLARVRRWSRCRASPGVRRTSARRRAVGAPAAAKARRDHVVCGSRVSPSGLSSSEAILATSLFGASPIEQQSPVAARTACLSSAGDLTRRPPDFGVAIRRRRSFRMPRRLRFTRAATESREVDVDLVDAAVFDDRRDRSHRCLEQARVLAVFVEIDRQQRLASGAFCAAFIMPIAELTPRARAS